MKLSASHDGSMVTFKATKGVGRDMLPLINLPVQAGSGDMTPGMTVVEGLPGGHNKDITLMTDIMSPVLRAFGKNVPAGLEEDADGIFDAASQTYRYPVLQRTEVDGAITIAADATVLLSTINLDLDAYIKVTLGQFEPTNAVPDPTVQQGAMLPGTYAGVDGSYRCNAANTENCRFDLVDGERIMVGPWQFVPTSANVSIADSDYLVFGGWLKRPQSQVGVGYSAGISATSVPYDNSDEAGINLDVLAGKAKYSGNAAGFFAERFIGTDTAKSGRFTATAELTADFSAGADRRCC